MRPSDDDVKRWLDEMWDESGALEYVAKELGRARAAELEKEAKLQSAAIVRTSLELDKQALQATVEDLHAKLREAEERAEKAEREMAAILDTMPADVVVRVREGAGPESAAASLAVSVAKMRERMETAEREKGAVVAGMLAMLDTHGRLSTETAEDFVGRLERERDEARERLHGDATLLHAWLQRNKNSAGAHGLSFEQCTDAECQKSRAALGKKP